MKYGIIGLIALLLSCATLGSKTRIFDDVRVKKINTIGLITKRFDQPRNIHHKIIKESFTRTLIEGLENRNLFTIILLDTLENENLNVESYSTTVPMDALLVAEWRLAKPNKMVTDAKVQLSLLDKDTKEVLLTSSHSTKFGNTYWSAPYLPRTLLDATDAALNTMEKKIRLRR